MKRARDVIWAGVGLAMLGFFGWQLILSLTTRDRSWPLVVGSTALFLVTSYWLVMGAWRRTSWMQARHARIEAERAQLGPDRSDVSHL